MLRVIVDTQSNPFFRGVALEQNYDQRGGLCQVGEGHIVITTHPIDPEYLDYWEGLGFTLPHFLVAGPFDSHHTLSDLILAKPEVQEEISTLVRGEEARLEFFCIEESEKRLAETLDIAPYCNFDVSIPLSRKCAFRRLCDDIGLPTPPGFVCRNGEQLRKQVGRLLSNAPVLVKYDDGTGGIACNSMTKVESRSELDAVVSIVEASERAFLVEKLIRDKLMDVSLHWRIDNGELTIINMFDQLSKNFSYAGVSFPSFLPDELRGFIERQLRQRLFPFLAREKAIGYFCCDIVVDSDGNIYWVDFNPRKGAILYIYDMVRRLAVIQKEKSVYFWHEHCQLHGDNSFKQIVEKLGDLLDLGDIGKPFVVITNPGVIPFHYVDITGISWFSHEAAKRNFGIANARLQES